MDGFDLVARVDTRAAERIYVVTLIFLIPHGIKWYTFSLYESHTRATRTCRCLSPICAGVLAPFVRVAQPVWLVNAVSAGRGPYLALLETMPLTRTDCAGTWHGARRCVV